MRLEDLGKDLYKQLEEKANEMAGKVFILSSPKQQVRTVMYEELKLDLKVGSGWETSGGVKPTCEAVLVICHPLPAIIPQHRHLARLIYW